MQRQRHARTHPDKIRPGTSVKGFRPTRRQRLALEMPQLRRNFRDARFRRVEMVGPRTFTDHYTGRKREELQWATALTVQMDSPPVWFLHCQLIHGPSDFQWPVESWPDYTSDLLVRSVETLIPDAKRRHIYGNRFMKSVVFRTRLRPEEIALLPAEALAEAWQ